MFQFDEFQEYVQMSLKEYLSDEQKDAVVRINEVTKNNGLKLHGISVQPKGSNIAPTLYLESYFKEYENGADLEVLMGSIAKEAEKHLNPPSEFANIGETFTDFESVKDKVIMVAVNTERNRELLNQAPHKEKEDLSLIYKVIVDTDTEGIATITIKNEHMKSWGVTTDEIHELAMHNTKEILPITVQSMNEVMMESFGKDGMPEEMAEAMFEEKPMNQQMYVISNKSRVNGAASVFYEDVLSDLADKMGTDLYILPSSVHEVIAVSTDMGSAETLSEMVREVNGTQVSAEEQLSDHVYKFDSKARTFSLADTTMEQLKAESSAEARDVSMSQNMSEGSRPRHRR